MRRTSRLGLPIFDNPTTDKFGLDEWNYANETIDEVYDEIDNIRKEIPKVNASAEVLEARMGKESLGDKMKEVSASLEQKASKNDLEVEKQRMNSFTSLSTGSTTGDAELIDGRIGANGKVYSNIGGAIREQVLNINNDLSEVGNAIKTYNELTPGTDYIIQNGAYSYSGTYPPTLDSSLSAYYNTTSINVNEGEKYRLVIWAYGTGVQKYDIYSSSSRIVLGGASTTTPTLTTIDVTIPTGGKTLIVTWKSGADYLPHIYKLYAKSGVITEYNKYLSVLKKGSINYSLSNDIITIEFNYGDDLAAMTFGKRGSNNLPDFRTLMVGNETLINNSTDWHSPFRVGAINNINGDHPNATTYYTGGNHDYNNGSSAYAYTTATARNSSIKYYADGKLISNGNIGVANNIKIEWINYVQGYNTSKANGTGREILQEHHVMNFNGSEFVSEVNIIPLEDINVISWFGFQIKIDPLITGNIKFIGGTNRGIYTDLSSSTYTSGNATPNKIIVYGAKHSVELEIDRLYDIGQGVLFNGTDGFFTTQNPKAYSNLIKNQNLTSNNVYSAKAKWVFAPL